MLSCSFRLFAILIAGALHSAQASLPVAEVEPNNTLDQATPTGLADFGVAIISPAEIGHDPDPQFPSDFPPLLEDYFRFTITNATDENPVLVTLAPNPTDPQLDLNIKLADADDSILMLNRDLSYPDQPNPLLQAYINKPSDYFVIVNVDEFPLTRKFGAPGWVPLYDTTYDLSITVTPGPANTNSIEPNDTRDEATFVEGNNVTITNQFIGDGHNGRFDIDRYRLDITPPAIVRATIETTNLNLAEPLLAARVPTGPATQDFLYHESDATARTLEFVVLDFDDIQFENTTDIIVRGNASAPDTGDYSPIGFYDLTIDITPIEASQGPFEPDNSASDATVLTLDTPSQTTLDATIGDGSFAQTSGDVDFFRLNIDGNQSLADITLETMTPDFRPGITLYDADLVPIARRFTNDTGVAAVRLLDDACPNINNTGTEDATVAYIAIMAPHDRPTEDPTLPAPISTSPVAPSLAVLSLNGGPGTTGQYRVTIETFTLSTLPQCSPEPNNTINDIVESVITNEGTYTCIDGSTCDGICPSDQIDADLYRVTVQHVPARIDVFFPFCGRIATTRIFDEMGNEMPGQLTSSDSSSGFENRGTVLSTVVLERGDYHIGVTHEDDPYDPFITCNTPQSSLFCNPESSAYNLSISLTPLPNTLPGYDSYPTQAPFDTDPTNRLFATRLDSCADNIIEIDLFTGETINAIPAPHAPFGGNEGLAYDGQFLYFLGNETAYPTLYKLDPDTGDILDQTNTWFGSGFYGDMTVAHNRLHILDMVDTAIHSIPTDFTDDIETTSLNFIADTESSLFGSITRLIRPTRFLLPKASDSSLVSEASSISGLVLAPIPLAGECPCDLDVNDDGQANQLDRDIVLACIEDPTPSDCRHADINCDRIVDFFDGQITNALEDVPPGETSGSYLCNTTQIGINKATAITVSGPNMIFSADWNAPVLFQHDPLFRFNRTLDTEAPLGSLASQPRALLADFDIDGDVDLLDFRHYQRCFNPNKNLGPACESFDFDMNGVIDPSDWIRFLDAATGPKQ